MISFLSDTAKFNLPRYMPVGFAFYGANMVILASDSTHVLLGLTTAPVTFDFIYFPEFYAPSSNYYTLDHTMDWESSQAYVSGVPAASGAFCGYIYTPGEFRPRIWIQPTAFDPTPLLVDLPAVSSAWYVPP